MISTFDAFRPRGSRPEFREREHRAVLLGDVPARGLVAPGSSLARRPGITRITRILPAMFVLVLLRPGGAVRGGGVAGEVLSAIVNDAGRGPTGRCRVRTRRGGGLVALVAAPATAHV
ncbi:hypothetical protein MAPG_00466 [Magnaporthiopsis poae ATCC 64411]|uniref:Uncharacterized protein n=1 Tax=Magnaporthiopsis poae (strain ATCC 64411 / 73-15) TaxID=644358 RepID=A0A0C4DL31_MAGP6|nr:hypothetical protein MAPG_00466 [Magnaporthiopsis poae ATCC 64411]